MSESSGRVDRVKQLCRRLGPFIGKKADTIFLAYLGEDKTGKEQIENYLEGLCAQHLEHGLQDAGSPLVPPEAASADGAYRLGTVVYAEKDLYPFGLRESEWIQHIGVFGRTGAGKTNLGYLILEQLQKHKKPFLVFDWKRTYRDLTALPGFQDICVFTPGRETAPLTFNPLIPPAGTPAKTWLKKIIEVIAHAYMLGNGVLYLLQESVNAVYERFGLYSGRIERYPTIRDVLEEAKKRDAKGREAGWLASALRALASMCFGDMDRVVNAGLNHHLADLLEKPVILELDALTQSDKVFFIQAVLLWIHHYRMTDGQRETFKHAILVEEAHHVLSGERRSLVGGQSVMEITFREIREFGESIIILDQHPSQVSVPALGNTYTTFCLNLKHSKDVSAMGQCMLMKGEEKDILGSLEVGQAVVKLQGRAPKPFLIKIPPFPIPKGVVSDAEIAEKMASFVGIRPGNRTSGVVLRENRLAARTAAPMTFPPARPTNPDLLFLQDVLSHPESGIAGRYKRLGISVRQGQKLKVRLVEEGFILETLETTRTGSIRVVRLTEKGEGRVQEANEMDDDTLEKTG
jgi:hypothetical protein